MKPLAACFALVFLCSCASDGPKHQIGTLGVEDPEVPSDPLYKADGPVEGGAYYKQSYGF